MLSNMTSRYFTYIRPTSYWDVVCRHLPLALVTGVPLMLALVSTPGSLPLKSCTFKALTNYPCPFCGYTRSFYGMASGDWAYAVYNCPLGALFFLFCVVIFVWNLIGLMAGVKLSMPTLLKLRPGQGKYLGLVVAFLFALNWGYRLIEGLK